MHHCTIRAFEGCACAPGKCRSATRPIIDLEKRLTAKRNADRALLYFTAALVFCCASAGLGYALVKLDRQIEIAARV